MKSIDKQKTPAFKRLRELMNDPRYWRDQDPGYVEMIRQGFRDLYDNPVEAGVAANEAGVNGPVHSQDDTIGHLTRGEIVIPKRAQTQEVMQALYSVLGEDIAQYIVGSGYEKTNPTSGLPAYADDSQFSQSLRAAQDMYKHYSDMKEANTQLSDQYFHCKANYDAASRGEYGEKTAQFISDGRELYGKYIKGDSLDDMVKDQLANKFGRRAVKSGKYRNSKDACDRFRPNGLKDKY